MNTTLRTSAIVLGAVVTALLIGDKLRSSSKEEAMAQRIEELEQAQAELRDRTQHAASQGPKAEPAAVPVARRAAQKPAPRDDEDTDSADSAGEEAPAAPAKAAPAMPEEAMRSAMEKVLAADAPDPEWTTDAARRAQQGVERTLPAGSKAVSVKCGGSMCRIETRHHGMDDVHQFLEGAFVNPATAVWNGGTFSSVTERSADGEVTVVSYIARDGEPLPVVSRM